MIPATGGRPRRSRIGAGAGAVVMLGALLWSGPGCAENDVAPGPPPRAARFGILRYLELFPRSAGLGGPFFLDRFESTQADWEAWLVARDAGRVERAGYESWNEPRDPDLPVVGIDLAAAREFAAWRFGRLPRYDEWLHAATGGGRYRLPWGDVERVSWANAEELGLSGLTPVGSFESGRAADGPFDLVGNAGEWTETPPPSWLPASARLRDLARGRDDGDLRYRLRRIAAHPGLRGWRFVPGAPMPLGLIVAVDDLRLTRMVIAGYTRPQTSPVEHFWSAQWRFEFRYPREVSSVVGVRVASDPDTLVDLLTAEPGPLDPADEAALRAFLRRSGVAAQLRAVALRWPERLARPGRAAAVLSEELGG